MKLDVLKVKSNHGDILFSSYCQFPQVFDIALSDGSELNFNKSLLHFNVKKIYTKAILNLTVNIEY